MNINHQEKTCEICKSIERQIELAVFTWEIVEDEARLYRHKLQGNCPDEKAA